MGKLKKNRNRGSRHNPLAKKTRISWNQEKKDENARTNKILPLIQKLQSSIPNERAMALGAVTVLCEDERMRKLLLKERLVSIVMEQCLNDKSDEIAVDAFGLLRNLGIEEGYDVVKYCWRQGIWTSIESSVRKIEESFEYLDQNEVAASGEATGKSVKTSQKTRQQLLYDFVENVISLVVVIASSSEELYENVLSKIDPVLKLVIDLVNWNLETNKCTFKLFNAVLDVLFEFSTESVDFIQKIHDASNFDIGKLMDYLSSTQQEKNCLGKVLGDGIRFNYFEGTGQIENKDEAATLIIKNIVSNITTINLDDLREDLTKEDNANLPIQTDAFNKDIGGESKKIQQFKTNVQTLDTAVDIITSIFEYLSVNEKKMSENVVFLAELEDALLGAAFPALSELLKFTLESKSVVNLSEKLLISINNLCWLFLTCDHVPVKWFQISTDLWTTIIDVSNQSEDILVQKDCLSICWAIAKTIGPEVKNKVSLDMITGLISKCNLLIQEESSYEFVLCAVGFLGAAAIFVEDTGTTEAISKFLISMVETYTVAEHHKGISAALEIAVESLNSIYDIFGDKLYSYDYDIYVKKNYNSILRALSPQVKEMYKKIDKNKTPELKVRAEEAWLNLSRFINYKESERN